MDQTRSQWHVRGRGRARVQPAARHICMSSALRHRGPGVAERPCQRGRVQLAVVAPLGQVQDQVACSQAFSTSGAYSSAGNNARALSIAAGSCTRTRAPCSCTATATARAGESGRHRYPA